MADIRHEAGATLPKDPMRIDGPLPLEKTITFLGSQLSRERAMQLRLVMLDKCDEVVHSSKFFIDRNLSVR